MDGTNKTELVPTASLGQPKSLVFDWSARNLYWGSISPPGISVMRLDGSTHYRRMLLGNTGNETGVANPVSMCLDPVEGLVNYHNCSSYCCLPLRILLNVTTGVFCFVVVV